MTRTPKDERATVDGVDVVEDAGTTIGTAIGRLYTLRIAAYRAKDFEAVQILDNAIEALETHHDSADMLRPEGEL